jgi:C4-dicarboxylate transporter, DctQ subunit
VRHLSRVDAILAAVERGLIVALLSSMLLLAFLQVLLRNLWDSGLPWVDILLRHQVLWLGIIGASLATRLMRHIRIDALARYLPTRWHRQVERGVLWLAGIVSMVLGLAAADLVRQEQIAGSLTFGPVPTWVLQLILPIGFIIVAFRFGLCALLPSDRAPGAGGGNRWSG